MTNKELKKRIEDVLMKSVDISRDFNNRDFKTIITSERYNTILYSTTKNTGYNSELGLFNFIIDFCSNVNVPKTISAKKPKGKNYMEYFFANGKLRLTRFIDDGKSGLSFYVGDDYVAEITESRNFAVSCVWLIDGKSQMFVETSAGSTGARIITGSGDGCFRLEEFDPFFYVSKIYKLVDWKYCEDKVEKRAIMPFDDGVSFMNKYNPYFINSKENGFFKICKSSWESFKENGWEIL